MEFRLQRCVSTDNSETGRSLMARSNHRIYRKELQRDWQQSDDTIFGLTKGKFVAMKQFCGGTCKREMKKLCQKEFDILNDCHHENVVTVLELFLEIDEHNPESWPAFFMELGECSLQFALTAKVKDTEEFAYPTGDGGYSWQHCISWLRQVANAMAYLHDKGIIHRDLKSSNVLLFESKTVCKVCDFDMSRYYDNEGMTVDVGTWRWMAPEVRNWCSVGNKQRYDLKVDCYSFGILICETIFRQRPFHCYDDRIFRNLDIPDTPLMEEASGAMTLFRDDTKAMSVHLNKEYSAFKLSDKLWQLVSKLLSWNPELRPNFNLIVSRLMIEASHAGTDREVSGVKLPPPLVDAVGEGIASDLPKTDTGLMAYQVCPTIPSVNRPRRTVKLLYSAELPDNRELTSDEKDRIVEMLKTNSDSIVSFHEEEQRAADRQATDGEVATTRILSQFCFTETGRLEQEISGADQDTQRSVAHVCRTSGKLLEWMAGLFQREVRLKRLRGLRFRVLQAEGVAET